MCHPSKLYDQAWLRLLSRTRVLKSFLVRALLLVMSLSSHKNIVSGGFATVHPNNKLTINVVEGAPLEDFSIEVRSMLAVYHGVQPIFSPGYSQQLSRCTKGGSWKRFGSGEDGSTR
jgi:hypothetical protein